MFHSKKMKNSIIILFIIIYNVKGFDLFNSTFGNFGNTHTLNPLCFNFSWLGPYFDDLNINCSDPKYKNTPCIKPIEISQSLPNLTDVWTRENKSLYTCLLRPGYSCIKYTYNFKDAILNTSYFCGKIRENSYSAVETGCISQQIGSYDVEVCSCRSTGFGMPCNSSNKNSFSLFCIILLLLFYTFHM